MALLLLASSCGSGTSTSSTEAPPLDEPNYAGVFADVARWLTDDGNVIIVGDVETSSDVGASIRVVDDLSFDAADAGREGSHTSVTYRNPLHGQYASEVLEDGPVRMFVVSSDNGTLLLWLELNSEDRFAALGEDRRISDASSGKLLTRGLFAGEFGGIPTPGAAVDPSRSIYCQDLGGTGTTRTFDPLTDSPSDLISVAREMVDALDAPDLEALTRQAEALAESAPRVTDEVTGLVTGGYAGDVVDQALRTGSLAGVTVHGTTPIQLDVGTLSWRVGDAGQIVFAEEGTKRVLGWDDYSDLDAADVDPFDENTFAVLMDPPDGGDVAVFFRPPGPEGLCLENAGAPAMTVPWDEVVGSKRATIVLDELTYREWRGFDRGPKG